MQTFIRLPQHSLSDLPLPSWTQTGKRASPYPWPQPAQQRRKRRHKLIELLCAGILPDIYLLICCFKRSAVQAVVSPLHGHEKQEWESLKVIEHGSTEIWAQVFFFNYYFICKNGNINKVYNVVFISVQQHESVLCIYIKNPSLLDLPPTMLHPTPLGSSQGTELTSQCCTAASH